MSQLADLITAFNESPVANRDGELLSSSDFLERADDSVCEQIDAILDAAAEELLATDGTADKKAIARARREGVNVAEAGDPQDPMETCLVIYTEHGDLQIPTVPDDLP